MRNEKKSQTPGWGRLIDIVAERPIILVLSAIVIVMAANAVRFIPTRTGHVADADDSLYCGVGFEELF